MHISDNSILITFGKTAQKNEKCQEKLKEYSIFNLKKGIKDNTSGYLSVSEIAKKWEMSEKSIRNYCAKGRITGAELKGKTWIIPENATKPGKSKK